MNYYFRYLLPLFAKHEVRSLVVGGYSAMYYPQPVFSNTSVPG